MGYMSGGSAGGSQVYEIRVRGCVHPASGWFEDMTITALDEGETLITGVVADQAALHGLLMQIRDLNLPLLSVVQKGQSDTGAHG